MKRLSVCVLALALAGSNHLVGANDSTSLSCGNSRITVSPARVRGGQQVLRNFLVNAAQTNSFQTFKFSAANDFLRVRCETSRNGEPLLLVNHYCGGSGCSENNFSVIDLKTFKVLLPADARMKGNKNIAEGIIGKKIKPFNCDRPQDGLCYRAILE